LGQPYSTQFQYQTQFVPLHGVEIKALIKESKEVWPFRSFKASSLFFTSSLTPIVFITRIIYNPIVIRLTIMSDIPETFDGKYYDRDYFQTPAGKKYRDAGGAIHGWSYDSPNGEWLGAGPIAKAWKEVFEPRNLLDVGAGRGTFIAYAREEAGIEAVGFDYSEWAVGDGRYGQIGETIHKCKEEWLRLHDATEPWPYEDDSFDLVVVLDFYEHIYEEDLDFVIGELYRVADKYVFLQIATTKGEGYILKKGVEVPLVLEGNAVAGHVTVQDEAFWYDRLDHEDWMARRDMVQHFCSLVDPSIIRNWLLNSILVYERIKD